MAAAPAQVSVGGHRIRVTNLDKVMYPETGMTKGEVIGYYQAVAPWFVAHARNRPATRKRLVNGVGTAEQPGQAFFEKNLTMAGTPSWVRTRVIEHREGSSTYPLVNDEATLVWLAQLAALELHVPQWSYRPRGGVLPPDRLVLDLDPGEGVGLPGCVAVAGLIRELLDGMAMTSVPVTSGSKGIHLYAGLDGSLSSEQATDLAHELAKALEADHPDLVISTMRRADRAGKVFIDWSQNNANKTTVAPYSLRGRPHPMVAAPRSWSELDDNLGQLDFAQVLDRLHTIGDPLAVLLPTPPDPADRLHTYRSMRSAGQTPEPMPTDPPGGGAGDSFVIQEHHARRLHWDFRLEHDGVLVSWAIPKGPPTDPRTNHLAVQTEDHPLAYGSFAGTIPKGQYGAGEVSIWDAGRYDCEKWREGKEVIVVLHGRPEGGLGGRPVRFALIHTGQGQEADNWLIHLMD